MADNSILVKAFLSKAEELGRPWLVEERDKALAAVQAGDQEITSLSYEGGSASGSSRINSQELLEILQVALNRYDGVEGSGGMILPHFSCLPL